MDGDEADEASVWRDAEGVGHEGLDHRGVALVCDRLDLDREGGDGHDVCRVEGTGKEEAFGMVEGDEDGGERAAISLG